MKKGLLIIISGPSGVGKGTIREYFMKDESLNLTYSISMTTRAPRAGEVNNVDYIFTDKAEFERQIKAGKLLEWAEFVGNYYGTPLEQVEKLRNEGKMSCLKLKFRGRHRYGRNVLTQLRSLLFRRRWKSLKNASAAVRASRKKLFSSAWRKQL